MRAITTCAITMLICAGCGSNSNDPGADPVVDPATTAESSEPAIRQDWPVHGGTYQRAALLAARRRSTRTRSRDLEAGVVLRVRHHRGQEATPIVVDGVLYTTTRVEQGLRAERRDRRALWYYDPKVPGAAGDKACCDVNSRGLAVSDGKVIIATLDGRLIALDRATGAPLWSTVTVDQSQMYTITGAPRVDEGQGPDRQRGRASSACAATSAPTTWRPASSRGASTSCPAIPRRDPTARRPTKRSRDRGADVVRHSGTRYGGGGTPWDAIVYDEELDQVYVGTGNGSPWNRRHRSDGKGDNLFLVDACSRWTPTPARTSGTTRSRPANRGTSRRCSR